ncbi:MAG: putative ABC transporter permease subunit [Gemmatimonadaceae bacterium]
MLLTPVRMMLHILSPKLQTVRARVRHGARDRLGRVVLFSVIGTLFWALIFGIVFRLLSYFKNVPEIGALLAAKLLGLVLLSFMGLLLLSNIITALSTFFLARDLDLLVGSPADWLAVYGAKLIETAVNSSWMVLLMAAPIFTAYGIAYDGGWWYPLVALAAIVPFLIIPAAIGTAFTLLLVNVFPARRTREVLSVITIVSAGGIVLAFRMLRPERLVRPEGFRSLVDFLAVLRTPTSPLLPSEWVQSGVVGWLTYEGDPLSFALLWSTAAALVVFGALLHRALYARAFSKAQESAGRTAAPRRRVADAILRLIPITRRELLLKELRVFFRDTTQWSQLILLVVLVLVYIFNVRLLPLRGDGVTFFLANLVPFLNLILAGFVLASIAARFLFPTVSMEGRTWWLLKASPLSMRDLLWAKFWVGTAPLVLLALGIVFTTDVLLGVSEFMTAVSVGTITLMTFALAGLAIGFGTLFPQFETENVAQIPTSFGGLLFMMTAIALIGAIIVLEARPVYVYLSARSFGTPLDATSMVTGFSAAAALCLVATFAPLRLAIRRLEHLER